VVAWALLHRAGGRRTRPPSRLAGPDAVAMVVASDAPAAVAVWASASPSRSTLAVLAGDGSVVRRAPLRRAPLHIVDYSPLWRMRTRIAHVMSTLRLGHGVLHRNALN
jgi:hypothetical protein